MHTNPEQRTTKGFAPNNPRYMALNPRSHDENDYLGTEQLQDVPLQVGGSRKSLIMSNEIVADGIFEIQGLWREPCPL